MADALDGSALPSSFKPESAPQDSPPRSAAERTPADLPEDAATEPTGLEGEMEFEFVAGQATWGEAPSTGVAAPLQTGPWTGLASARLALAMAAVLVLGAYFRLVGINWDSNTHLHPDERFITMVENALTLPKDLGEYFDTARSPLNPYNRGYNSFVYGTFPLFLVRWLGDALGMVGYDQIHLVGRATSALFDLGTVFLIFLIGRRVYGARAGVLAAALTAGAVIQIQQAHFFTFDTFSGFFLVASFLFAVRIWQGERWYDYPLLGAFLGLAAASKINSIVFVLVVGLVALKQMHEVAVGQERDRMAEWLRILGSFCLSAATALIVFRVVEPYAFTGPGFLDFGISKKFLDDMGYVQRLVSGDIDQPPSVQWANTTPYLFPLRNLILWGMGLPFGLVGWAGLLFAAYRLIAKQDSRHLLLVVWVTFFFWYQGGQMAKTMRYFVPIVPLLALLGAHLLLQIDEAVRSRVAAWPGQGWSRVRRYLPYAGQALAALVVVATLLYALAFTGIYTRPITRIEASEWIFANIPQGTPIANEHWDDPLPMRWKGRDAGWYRGAMLELYNEDNPDKLRKLVEQLDATQYIFLSSNRLYGSIPRMPMKYPMTTEYYRLLFSGELGFRLAKSFTSYPSLFGLQLNDDSAEEIFSVYDHPKVLIFQKTPEYSGQKVRELLGAVPLDRILRIKTVQAGHNGLLLAEGDRAVQQSGGTWSAMYDREGLANRFPIVSWWLALELLGLLALPLAWRLFARFPDRGYGFAKVLGLLIVVYVAWLLPSLRALPFGPLSILGGLALLAAIALAVLRTDWARFVEFLGSHRRAILVHELVFAGAFALFLVIRMRNPDLWHGAFGGEKPMEFAYLNAVAKSTYFPPYDPWLAGGYINYYYFGFVIVATLMRLTGVVPFMAFNLAIASIFALTAAGLFSFGFNYALVTQRLVARVVSKGAVLAGLATAAFVLVVGNLDGLLQIVDGLWKQSGIQVKSTIPMMEGGLRLLAGAWAVLLGGKVMPPFDFWRSTRIIGPENPTPITEFPYFTFIYGDLHPHMISMPLAALALGLALAIVWNGAKAQATGHKAPLITHNSSLITTVIIGGLVVGALQATNSWDFPTYLLLLSGAFLLSGLVRDRGFTVKGLAESVLAAVGTYVVAQLLFLPFTRAYELFYNGVDPAPAKTSIQHYLVIFGFFLFCVGSTLLIGLAGNRWHRFWARALWERVTGSPRARRRTELSALLVRPTPWMELLPYLALALAGLVLLALVAKLFLVAMLIAMGSLALLSLFDRDLRPEKSLLAIFVGLAAALTLGVEFVTIKGDIGRMNTVFKFYLQAWFLLGIVSALGVAGILWRWRSLPSVRLPRWRGAWMAAAGLLFASVLIYPVAATPVKVGARFQPSPPTLDGMAYMKQAAFKDQNKDVVLARDYAALSWLQDRVVGSPVVLEAQVPEYRWGSRVSIYTGLPTVLGWTWHQRQQRSSYQWMIDERLRDIKTAFDTADTAQASALLRRYGVSLVYVGDLERAYYSPQGLAKFDAMVGKELSVVYQADGVTIYEVMRDGSPSVVS